MKAVLRTIIFISFIIFVINKVEEGKGTNKGAYLSVPDSSKLQYRFGNGLGYVGKGWDDAKMANLSSMAGYDGQRKKLPEQHLVTWGYGIEVDDCKVNTKLGILDVIGYLATPTKAHSSNATDNAELCYPDNLYEPIWLEDGTVNPSNYWAYYVYQVVSHYKDYIKIWETWNEPDYTRNYGDVGNWKSNPPNPKDLVHWYGTIFEYIRLLRITYEVAKKVDPDCFVATGGLGYSEFLDAILRYTDNPDEGKVTDEYPAYGGAYFDCDAYHQYPQYGVTDLETGKAYNDNGSDSLAKKVVILKKNHEYTIKQYGFDGKQFPKKIYVNTETGVNSEEKEGTVGGDLVRRNWILKLALYCIEYDVKQHHMLVLTGSSGDYNDLDTYVSMEEGFKNLKSSSKGRLALQKIKLGKFEFDESETSKLRDNLPAGLTGIALRRKFEKEEGEDYYGYMYSVWVYCEKEEIGEEQEIQLDIGDSLKVDWLGNEVNLKNNDKFTVSSTPIFLLLRESKESSPSPSSGSFHLYSRYYLLALLLSLII
mgnify:FL=1